MMTNKAQLISMTPKDIPREVTEKDEELFLSITSTDLTDEQRERVRTPAQVFHGQKAVLGVHWHPEFVAMDDIKTRIDRTFPNKEQELFIPTQHNEILSFGKYAGVEVDCYSSGFNQKVQLLLHFEADRLKDGHRLNQILEHTMKYRASQLYDFMHTLIKPDEERISLAVKETGISPDLVDFVRLYVQKIHTLLEQNTHRVPQNQIKNKILRNFFDGLRDTYGDPVIDRCQTFLTAVKKIVKEHFSLTYFYRASEIIEEARGIGGGIVIPHPEQFWPILLSDYDVDGVEVWNPQSRRYTEFLISIINTKNMQPAGNRRPLLIFMGDDTHFGEKVREPRFQNMEKASREVGVQPAWDDFMVRKALILANTNRRKTIQDYKDRLAG